MLPNQLKASGIESVPKVFRQWINIKMPFADWSGAKARGMKGMLSDLQLELTGRHHRGIDDCRNISKIAKFLIEKGVELDYTSELALSRYPGLSLVCCLGDETAELLLEKRSVSTLFGRASSLFRRQLLSARLPDDRLIECDLDLCDLSSGETVLFSD
jgi:hypothetical protein